MKENILKNKQAETNQEKLVVKIGLAEEKDWEAIRDLRLEAITSDDADMLGFSPESNKDDFVKEQKKSEEDWKKEINGIGKFTLVAWHAQELIGIGQAKKEDYKDWYVHSGYIKKDFQGEGTGKKMLEVCLREIKNRGGKKVRLGVKVKNEKMIHVAESFGFKIVDDIDQGTPGYYMELNLNTPKETL